VTTSSDLLEWTTDGLGSNDEWYTLVKFRKLRKQVALMSHGGSCSQCVAYFRSEDLALAFAAVFGLKVHSYELPRQ
jgi:hypothetical protein